MTTNIYNTVKRTYNSPQIERIRLDNEISLILNSVESDSPDGEPTSALEYFNNDPFKGNNA